MPRSPSIRAASSRISRYGATTWIACHDFSHCGVTWRSSGPTATTLTRLSPASVGKPGEEGTGIGGARRPSHLAEHGRLRAQLGGHLLLAEADLVGEAPALVGGAHPLARQRPPLGELIGEEHEKDEGHRDPRGEEHGPRHGTRSVNTMLIARSWSPAAVATAAGLISQLLSAKRRLTTGSRMRPAMNCATSTRGGPPGRAGVRASMRSVSSGARGGRRTRRRCRGRARAGRRGHPPHLDELQLEPWGGLLAQGRQDIGPAHLTAGLLGEGLEVRSEQAQVGLAGGQVAREPRHRGEIALEAPGRRQHAREEDREQDERAGQRDEGQAPQPPRDPVTQSCHDRETRPGWRRST